MMHLYPMLGVRKLVSDKRLEGSKPRDWGGNRFYLKEFANVNVGQYAPTKRREVMDAKGAVRVMSDPSFDPRAEYVVLRQDLQEFTSKATSAGHISSSRKGIKFKGNSKEQKMHVLPVLFSNCLKSSGGYKLTRVNLILTGIIFQGKIEDRITFDGPPFANDCLRKDKEDIEKFNLKDLEFPSIVTAHKPILTRWANVAELFDLMGWW